MRQWNKKILAVHMQWDYCDPTRGPGPEKRWFYDNFKVLAPASEVFFYDEYVGDLALLRKKLLEKAEAFNPDLIFFVPFTDQFPPEFLDQLKARWPTCAWFADDRWRFDKYTSKLSPHFTHVLTTDPFSLEKHQRIGVKAILTQWAATPGAGYNSEVPVKYNHEVSFIGGRNQVRDWFLKILREQGVQVDCFGAGWPAGRVSYEEMDEIFRTSRINLNLSNSAQGDIRYVFGGVGNLVNYLRSRKNAEDVKARNFEIPFAGGFQLTNYVPHLERHFEIGKEIAVYTTPEDCAWKIRYYLANEPERASIAAAGRSRALKDHTYLRRLELVLEKIWGEPRS